MAAYKKELAAQMKESDGDVDVLTKFFEKMRSDNFVPDLDCYRMVMPVKHPRLGILISRIRAIYKDWKDEHPDKELIYYFQQLWLPNPAKGVRKALRTLEEHSSFRTTPKMLLCLYASAESGFQSSVIQVVSLMLQDNVSLDRETLCFIFAPFIKTVSAKNAGGLLRLFAQLVAHKDLVRSTDLLQVFPEDTMNEYTLALCEKEQFQYAARYLMLASELGLHVNEKVFEAIICHYCARGMLKGPLVLLQEMDSMGISLSDRSMNALVDAFNKAAVAQ